MNRGLTLLAMLALLYLLAQALRAVWEPTASLLT